MAQTKLHGVIIRTGCMRCFKYKWPKDPTLQQKTNSSSVSRSLLQVDRPTVPCLIGSFSILLKDAIFSEINYLEISISRCSERALRKSTGFEPCAPSIQRLLRKDSKYSP